MLCKRDIRVVLGVVITAPAWGRATWAWPSGEPETPSDVPQASFEFNYDESRKDGIEQLLAGSRAETRQACVEFAPESTWDVSFVRVYNPSDNGEYRDVPCSEIMNEKCSGSSTPEEGTPGGEHVGEACQHVEPIIVAMSIVALVCIPIVTYSAWGCAKHAGGIFGKIACWTGGIVATLGCSLLSKAV
jgi:hypothetical protein